MGLLSTTNHYHKKEYVNNNSKVEITEKRASTDESVKLLYEMQEKALQSILARIPLPENFMKGDLFIYEDQLRFSIVVHVRFELNGQNYEAQKTLDKRDYERELREKIWSWGSDKKWIVIQDFVIEQLSKAIAEQIVYMNFEKINLEKF